jgi:transposase
MSRKPLWVGLDIGADEMIACGTDDHGSVLFEHLVPTTASALDALLKKEKRRIKLIGLEAGSFGIVLTRALRKLGYRVAVFDARQCSKFLAIRRNKTDKNDARGLADIARLGRASVSEVRVKSPECQQLKSMLVRRQKLLQMRVTAEGSIRSLFRLNGGRLKSSYSAAALKKNVTQELARLKKAEKLDLTEDVAPLLALSEAIRTYLETLDRKLEVMAADHPICRRFLEIPGVGPICALSFYAVIEDPNRFRRNAYIGAYLGMVPGVRQSGQNMTKLRISKMGDTMTRSYLTTAAQHHLVHGKSALTAWGALLGERLRKGGVKVAVGRKLAVTMLSMWKSGECYDPNRGISRTPAIDPEALV